MKSLPYTLLNGLFLGSAILTLSACIKDEIESPVPEEQPYTENKFSYELMDDVLHPDSTELMSVLEQNDNILLFSSASVFAAQLQVGDIFFAPSLSDTFHLTRLGFKVMEKTTGAQGIQIVTAEPALKELYHHFYLEVNNANQIQFRDPIPSWNTLTQAQINDIKLVDASVLEVGIPINANTVLTLKLANVSAQTEFEYRFSTEYFSENNTLADFEFGMKNIVIKGFTMSAEAEVKLHGIPPSPAPVTIFAVSNGEVNLLRVPLPLLAGFGIPLTTNVDIPFDMEASLAGKVSMGINFGDIHLQGDPLIIRFGLLDLDDIAWSALTYNFNPSTIVSVINPVENFELVSFPNQFMATGNDCVQVNAEITGSIKALGGFGLSFSLLGYPLAAVGVYFDMFAELVGKANINACISNDTIITGGQLCFEVNRGMKLPYFMATSKNVSPNPLSYNYFKLSVLGEVKSNYLRLPANCNPLSQIEMELGEQHIGTACSGDRLFMNARIVPPAVVDGNATYKIVIDGHTIPNLAYEVQQAFYLDEHGLGSIGPLDPIVYEVFDEMTNTRIGIATIYAANCATTGCTALMDPHLPTYGTQTYCSFVPTLPSYNRRWIRDNMYYTSRPSGFDPLEDGRCYEDSDVLCKEYGRYYTWYAANGPRRNVSAQPFWQGTDICPLGYHIPSRQEWESLIEAADGLLGFAALCHEAWPGLFDLNRNTSGFSAYPFGFVVPGNNAGNSAFQGVGTDAYYWTSTEIVGIDGNTQAAWAVHISANGGIRIVPAVKTVGMTCRCIADQ